MFHLILLMNSDWTIVQVKVSKVTGKFCKTNVLSKINTKQKPNRKPATHLSGLCLIHDNPGAHKCNLVPDFLETETVVHDVVPCSLLVVMGATMGSFFLSLKRT